MKTNKPKHVRPAGLHLWCVSLSQYQESLWITTSTMDAVQAITKAVAFIKLSIYSGATIKGLEHRGTIDA